MSDLAIRTEGLGKRYRIGAAARRFGTLRETLAHAVGAPVRNLSRLRGLGSIRDEGTGDVVWALRDVSFELPHGEVLGVIGPNGAGKSTLLKILSRITRPTVGRAEVHGGRVGALLEVGTGFHPELTGRENIYLNGSILGMDRAYITRRFDEIVAFAGVERFIDTPVKRYSSGMHLRLAFAVAAHLEPEILIVDEVLAVGDAEFQRRCLGKMGQVARDGRTVLFVSHNMVAVMDLCARALWLDHGTIRDIGPAGTVVPTYLQSSSTVTAARSWEDVATAPGGGVFRLHTARIRPSTGPATDPITVHTPLMIEVVYWNLEPGAYLNVNLQIFNAQGVLLFEAGPMDAPIWRPSPAGLLREVCHIPGNLLNNGLHRVSLRAVTRRGSVVYSDPDLLGFEVQDTTDLREGWYGEWAGAVRPALGWRREVLSVDTPVEATA